MRDPIRVWRTGTALHRWLRRAAVTAVPLVGLCGCGNDCHDTVGTSSRFVDGGIAWAPGSSHSAVECFQYCRNLSHNPCVSELLTGCLVPVDAGSIIQCQTRVTSCFPNCGRIPAGLKRASAAAQPSAVAAQLAAAAYLEGASVFAFEALERELVAHGAPTQLVARAKSAQRDEKRHHSAISGLAIRFGARVPAVDVEPAGIRTFVEMAIENAVEGCVRETYGAAVAALQGESAGNLSLRRAMAAIAVDEAEHASLAWAVDVWARPLLTLGERAQVEALREEARTQLIATAQEPVSPELSRTCGLPTPAAAAHLITALTSLGC